MYTFVKFLHTIWDWKWRLSRQRFEESLFEFGECFRQKEVIRSTAVLKKYANFLPVLASHWFFQNFSVILVIALCFWLSTCIEWIVYFGCFAFKCKIRWTIYGRPEAVVGKLRKLLDCKEVRRNMISHGHNWWSTSLCEKEFIWFLSWVNSI